MLSVMKLKNVKSVMRHIEAARTESDSPTNFLNILFAMPTDRKERGSLMCEGQGPRGHLGMSCPP